MILNHHILTCQHKSYIFLASSFFPHISPILEKFAVNTNHTLLYTIVTEDYTLFPNTGLIRKSQYLDQSRSKSGHLVVPRAYIDQRPCARSLNIENVVFCVSAIRHDSSLSKCPKQKQSPPGKHSKWHFTQRHFECFPGGDCFCLGHLLSDES